MIYQMPIIFAPTVCWSNSLFQIYESKAGRINFENRLNHKLSKAR